jgi:hypothetical protein
MIKCFGAMRRAATMYATPMPPRLLLPPQVSTAKSCRIHQKVHLKDGNIQQDTEWRPGSVVVLVQAWVLKRQTCSGEHYQHYQMCTYADIPPAPAHPQHPPTAALAAVRIASDEKRQLLAARDAAAAKEQQRLGLVVYDPSCF